MGTMAGSEIGGGLREINRSLRESKRRRLLEVIMMVAREHVKSHGESHGGWSQSMQVKQKSCQMAEVKISVNSIITKTISSALHRVKEYS